MASRKYVSGAAISSCKNRLSAQPLPYRYPITANCGPAPSNLLFGNQASPKANLNHKFFHTASSHNSFSDQGWVQPTIGRCIYIRWVGIAAPTLKLLADFFFFFGRQPALFPQLAPDFFLLIRRKLLHLLKAFLVKRTVFLRKLFKSILIMRE